MASAVAVAILNLSPLISVSLASTSMVTDVSSSVIAVSLTATGAVLVAGTVLTVIVNDCVAVPPLPSSAVITNNH